MNNAVVQTFKDFHMTAGATLTPGAGPHNYNAFTVTENATSMSVDLVGGGTLIFKPRRGVIYGFKISAVNSLSNGAVIGLNPRD